MPLYFQVIGRMAMAFRKISYGHVSLNEIDAFTEIRIFLSSGDVKGEVMQEENSQNNLCE